MPGGRHQPSSSCHVSTGVRAPVVALAIALLLPAPDRQAVAGAQRFTDYLYDEAGNVVATRSSIATQPPQIATVTPGSVTAGSSTTVSAIGTGLRGVLVGGGADLVIENLTTTATEARFDLTVAPGAALGPYPLSFRTLLGVDTAMLAVLAADSTDISTRPTPIALAADGVPRAIEIRFPSAFAADEQIDFSVSNPALVGLSAPAATLNAGATTVTVELAGLTLGAASFTVSVPNRFLRRSFPVFVTPRLGPGETLATSGPIGLVVGAGDSHPTALPEPLASGPVGILVGAATESAPIAAPVVGVAVGGDERPSALPEPVVSTPLGVSVGGDERPSVLPEPVVSTPVGVSVGVAGTGTPIAAAPVGVDVGPVARTLAPAVAAAGTVTVLSISGFNLAAVNDLLVAPVDDMTVTLPPTVNAAGTQAEFTVTVAPGATLGKRTISLVAPSGPVPVDGLISLELEIQ